MKIASTVAAAAVLGVGPPALAAEPSSEASTTITANVGAQSQYVFRGLAQTNRRPALQGGADLSHDSGLYAGTWLSNVSWFADTNPGVSNSLEWDVYGGWRTSPAPGLTLDVGAIHYAYPGRYPALPAGTVEPDTTELYAGATWRWVALKYSYSLTDAFGVDDSEGTSYLDLTVTVPMVDALTLVLHAGRQEFSGASAAARSAGLDNDALYSYEGWRVAVAWAFAEAWTATAAYSDTNAEPAGYTVQGENLGERQFVFGVARAF